MNRDSLLRIVGCLALLSASQVFAAEEDVDLVEKVAVRNRLYNVDGRFELGANVGFSILSRLTEHYNFNVAGAYNFAEWLGVEARVGYALSRHTSLADQIQSDFVSSSISTANDLADLWQMTFNSAVGVRFQPIYGKVNLVAELPVHFQLYLWAGGGLGLFKRQSLVICTQKNGSDCGSYFEESKPGPLVSVALGFRFFVAGQHAVRLEVRDWSYLDSYFIDVKRDQVTPGSPTAGGRLDPAAGVTNLVQLDLGYTFLF